MSEVEFSVEEGAAGEFAVEGGASAGGDGGGKYFTSDEGASVTVDFENVVSGVRIRRGEEGDEGLVDDGAGRGI